MTKREQRELSENRIIAATLQIVALRGVSRATLAEIGESAGYSRGLPAHLFGNKDALLAECVRRIQTDYWINVFPEIDEYGAFHALITAIGMWVRDLTAENGTLPRARLLLLQEVVTGSAPEKYPTFVPAARKFISASQHRFQAYILAGQNDGEIRADLDTKFHATLIYTTLRGVSQRWLIDSASIDVVEFSRTFIDYLKYQLLVSPEEYGKALAKADG